MSSSNDGSREMIRIFTENFKNGNGSIEEEEFGKHQGVIRLRPSLFHTRLVSGCLMNELSHGDSNAESNWRLYLSKRDGGRVSVPLVARLDIPKRGTIQFDPLPDSISADKIPRWSQEGRDLFLNGESPDPAKLYLRLRDVFNTYIEFSGGSGGGGEADLLTIWTFLTYLYPVWPSVPYLAIGGHYGSGKTRVLDIINALAFAPTMSASASTASIYMSMHETGGTLLLDESEMLGSNGAAATEINRILNAGYRRGGEVRRTQYVRGKRRPVAYQIYGPKAIAGINGLSSTLESRCIRITLARAHEGSEVARRRFDGNAYRLGRLRDGLYCFALARGPEIVELSERSNPCKLSNRDYELWAPIFTLASFFQDHGIEGLVANIEDLVDEIADTRADNRVPHADMLLLRQLAAVVRANCQNKLRPQDLLHAVSRLNPDIFSALGGPRSVSNVLRPYGIRTVRSNGSRVFSRVGIADLQRISSIYGVDLGVNSIDPCAPCDPPTRDGKADRRCEDDQN